MEISFFYRSTTAGGKRLTKRERIRSSRFVFVEGHSRLQFVTANYNCANSSDCVSKRENQPLVTLRLLIYPPRLELRLEKVRAQRGSHGTPRLENSFSRGKLCIPSLRCVLHQRLRYACLYWENVRSSQNLSVKKSRRHVGFC